MLGPISNAEFEELCTKVKVPCLITKNNSDDGLILAAYQFMWEGTGNAVLIQLPETPALVVGEPCLYQKIGGRVHVTPGQPVDSDGIMELNAAKQEFLPQMFAN